MSRICRCLGKALQFTNILRDVGMTPVGEVYLPKRSSDAMGDRGGRSRGAKDGWIWSPSRWLLRTALDTTTPWALRLPGSGSTVHGGSGVDGARCIGGFSVGLERRRFPVLDPDPVRLSKAHKLTVLLLAWIRETGILLAGYGPSIWDEPVPPPSLAARGTLTNPVANSLSGGVHGVHMSSAWAGLMDGDFPDLDWSRVGSTGW